MRKCIVILIIGLLFTVMAAEISAGVEFWYEDNNMRKAGGYPEDFKEMFEKPETWKEMRSKLSVYYIRGNTLKNVINDLGEEWKTVQVSQRTTPFSLSGRGTKKKPISRPRILAQESDGKTSAYMFFRDIERDNRISVAICADLKTPIWEMKDLTETSVSMWEPSLDSAAWQRDQTVYLYAQRVEQGDGEKSVASKPSEVAIIKWKPAK